MSSSCSVKPFFWIQWKTCFVKAWKYYIQLTCGLGQSKNDTRQGYRLYLASKVSWWKCGDWWFGGVCGIYGLLYIWRILLAVFEDYQQGSHFLSAAASALFCSNPPLPSHPLPVPLSLCLPAMCSDCISHCAGPHSKASTPAPSPPLTAGTEACLPKQRWAWTLLLPAILTCARVRHSLCTWMYAKPGVRWHLFLMFWFCF